MAEETKPALMPWQENYDLKPTQAPVAPTLMQRAQEGASQVVEAVKSIKMPWEMQWTEKPRPTLSKPIQADVRKNEPAAVDSFLSKMETVESGGVADAKNPTSTATGLHQFTAGTWRDTVAEMGKDYTLADRKDPVKSREVARFFTQQNAKQAESELGRKPTEVDLYMYHFLGRGAAGEFLKAPRDEEATKFVSSKAARDNAAVFYSKGKPRTVGEVLNIFGGKFDGLPSKKDNRIVDREVGDTSISSRYAGGVQSFVSQMEKTSPEFGTISKFVKSLDMMPDIKVEITGNRGEFSREPNDKDKGVIALSPSLFDSDGNPKNGAQDTIVHEMAHAADRQLKRLAYDINTKKESELSPEEKQFQQAMKRLDYDGANWRKGNAVVALAKKLSADWYEKEKDYRATAGELRGFAMGRTQEGAAPKFNPPSHLDTTLASEMMILIDLASKIKERKKNA